MVLLKLITNTQYKCQIAKKRAYLLVFYFVGKEGVKVTLIEEEIP